jgi:aryl-alcohol dehydrogenase
MQITAAVVREKSGAFNIERIDLCDPRDDELLVEVTASGMCATDLHGRDAYYPTQFPKVFGHEGAGAVLNVMKPKPGDSFAVFGVGAVGLSGLMAAKIAGCDPIIAVDVHEHRLKLARELGATHTINHNGRTDVVADIRKLTGLGARFSLETSALAPVFREAVDCLMPAGTCVLLGSARAGTEVTFETPFLQNGRTVRGVIQGDSVPQEFIPQLADYIVAGKFPIERMITFYDLADINRAAAESSTGKTIKPVLRMPR